MDVGIEIAIAAVLQIGALIWSLAGIKSDVRNLTSWVGKIDERSDKTSLIVARLEGMHEGPNESSTNGGNGPWHTR